MPTDPVMMPRDRAGSRSGRRVPRAVVRPVAEFMRWEAASGVVLLAATIAALVWANTGAGGYEAFWTAGVRVAAGGHGLGEDLRHLVNDGLMALFFLVVGLEVKRELAVGELSDRRAAMLPLAAALGGMALPAGIFLAVTVGGEGTAGWGIPMATDIAFALGLVSLVSRRVPPALVVFLLGVAVIDDIGAIVVIAVAYSDGIALGWLAAALVALAAVWVLTRIPVRSPVPYAALGLVAWFCTYRSGVHATLAGVALGLLAPARPVRDRRVDGARPRATAPHALSEPSRASPATASPVWRVEHALQPWTSFVVLPIFALANAGIALDGGAVRDALGSRVTLGVVLGLLVGKVGGILAGSALAVRLGLARLPAGVDWRHMAGIGTVAGVGFTVSLFITALAYGDHALSGVAKLGILGGSVLSGAAGIALLLTAARRRPAGPTAPLLPG